MKRVWSKFDLQSKTRIIACLGLAIWLSSFFILFAQIKSINHATLSLEYAENLFETILEIRRYEKNFLLYQGQDNKNQILHLFNEAKEEYQHMRATPEIAKNFLNMNQWRDAFKAYGDSMGIHDGQALTKVSDSNAQEKIRFAGRHLVQLSQGVLKKTRKKIA